MPLIEVRKCATMPDGSNVRHYLVGIMSQVQQAMLKNAEDNTKSFFALIQVRIIFFHKQNVFFKFFVFRVFSRAFCSNCRFGTVC